MNEFQIDGRRFCVLNDGHPLSEADVLAFEKKIGIQLPTQLRNYYLHWNGGLPYPLDAPELESIWVRLRWKQGAQAARVGQGADLNDLFLINADPARDYFLTWTDFKHRIPSDCLCFGCDSGGSLFLIGIQPHNLGKVYFWASSYEAILGAGESPGYDNVAYVADSFEDFLLALRGEPKSGETLDAWARRVYLQ